MRALVRNQKVLAGSAAGLSLRPGNLRGKCLAGPEETPWTQASRLSTNESSAFLHLSVRARPNLDGQGHAALAAGARLGRSCERASWQNITDVIFSCCSWARVVSSRSVES